MILAGVVLLVAAGIGAIIRMSSSNKGGTRVARRQFQFTKGGARFPCPECREILEVGHELLGQHVACDCGAVMQLPPLELSHRIAAFHRDIRKIGAKAKAITALGVFVGICFMAACGVVGTVKVQPGSTLSVVLLIVLLSAFVIGMALLFTLGMTCRKARRNWGEMRRAIQSQYRDSVFRESFLSTIDAAFAGALPSLAQAKPL